MLYETAYTTRQMTPTRTRYELGGTTKRGERVIVELEELYPTNGVWNKEDLPWIWAKRGLTRSLLPSVLFIEVTAIDESGREFRKYNPQHIYDYDSGNEVIRCLLDGGWLLSCTEENRQKLLKEVVRRANLDLPKSWVYKG